MTPPTTLSTLLSNGTASNALTWVFRVGLLALILWIRGNFVSQDKYNEDASKRLNEWIEVGKKVQHIDDSLTNFQQDFTKLNDHENRLRTLEKQRDGK